MIAPAGAAAPAVWAAPRSSKRSSSKPRRRSTKAADREAWKEAHKRGAGNDHGREEYHQPAQRRPLRLWHQCPDEHHQQHGRAAHPQQPADLVWRAGRKNRRRMRQRTLSWSMIPPAMPARWPARRKSRPRKVPTKACAWRARNTSRSGHLAPTAATTTSTASPR